MSTGIFNWSDWSWLIAIGVLSFVCLAALIKLALKYERELRIVVRIKKLFIFILTLGPKPKS